MQNEFVPGVDPTPNKVSIEVYGVHITGPGIDRHVSGVFGDTKEASDFVRATLINAYPWLRDECEGIDGLTNGEVVSVLRADARGAGVVIETPRYRIEKGMPN